MFAAYSRHTEAAARKASRRPSAVQQLEPAPAPPAVFKAEVVPIKTPAMELRDAIVQIAREHGTSYDEIMGKSRVRNVLLARHKAIRVAALMRPTWATPQLGRYFGKDHTSILYVLGRLKHSQTGKKVRT